MVDEPHSQEQDSIIIEYARVIQEAQPEVVIWDSDLLVAFSDSIVPYSSL